MLELMVRLIVTLLAVVALVRTAGAQETRYCGTPVAIGDGCSLAEPAAVGLDTRELCRVDEFVRQWPDANIHAIVVVRHGKLILERYYSGEDQRYRPASLGVVEFAPDVKHDVRSISKSVTSLLLGIALNEGKFPPLDSPVLDAFSECPDRRAPEKMPIDFRHLLTMSSGLAWDERSRPYTDPDNS